MTELAHYGTKRHSGRYPWGSGDDPMQSGDSLMGYVDEMRDKGMTDVEIARSRGMSRNEMQTRLKAERLARYEADRTRLLRLKENGYSNVAAAQKLGMSEAKVRSMLKEPEQNKANKLTKATDDLKKHLEEKGMLDVGSGVEAHMGLSRGELDAALSRLKDEGYAIENVKVEQLGTGKDTTIKVLAPPGTKWSDIQKNTQDIKSISVIEKPDGHTDLGIDPPVSFSSKRLAIKWDEDGGSEMDGVMEIRPGVPDISLGKSRYAQARIAVDDTHYIKGMAMYNPDLPDGVDIRFNTNKPRSDNKLDALKKMKDDPDNPFGAIVRQRKYIDIDGKEKQSAINLVNEEGDWSKWSKSLASQMLSKQTTELASEQLAKVRNQKRLEYDEIMSLTNPVVKRKLLESYSDGCDAAAVHLKAAALPRSRSHVILPINDLKPNEIYAPNYRDGERVALIRYPHGGRFEIPELVVNNKNKTAKSTLQDAIDAVGIHHSVAERLSGADFDGDSVMVIPNNHGKVKSMAPLKGLENFDTKKMYPGYEGMKTMKNTQKEMGVISNLITDMTIKGAGPDELARAVRHSMVVIDAEKHGLNYKQSEIDNGIKALQRRYQSKPNSDGYGASTLISQAKADVRVKQRKETYRIDPATGKKIYQETGASYVKDGKVHYRTTVSKRLLETDDAHTLSSGSKMETIYADHSNQLKAMANQARKDMINTPLSTYDRGAKTAYASEIASLDQKLARANYNRPLERQAQITANAVVKAKKAAHPDLSASDIKKLKSQALTEARARTGAHKEMIDITPKEWEAIQAGAISASKLNKVLDNTDLDLVKEYATPRSVEKYAQSTVDRAQAMRKNGYTRAEIADALGMTTSSLNKIL